MNKLLLALLLTTLIFGCATKVYRAAPALANPSEYAELFIIRNSAFAGMMGKEKVMGRIEKGLQNIDS